VDSIAQLVASRDFEPGECAVMYRTNAQSRLLERPSCKRVCLIAWSVRSGSMDAERVKDVIAFLRLVHNPADEASLDRVINIPPRGIGDKTLMTLHTVARRNDTSAGVVLLDIARGSNSPLWSQFAGRSVIPLADFGASLANWASAAPALTVPELFRPHRQRSNYKAYVDDESEEGENRWENVEELRRLTLEYSTRTLDDFLEYGLWSAIRILCRMVSTRPRC